jgi:hypothetical protein
MRPSDSLKVEISHYTAREHDPTLNGVHVALSDFSKSPRSQPEKFAKWCAPVLRRSANWPQTFARRNLSPAHYQLIGTIKLDRVEGEGELYEFARLPEYDEMSIPEDLAFKWVRNEASTSPLQGEVLTYKSTERMFTGSIMANVGEIFILPGAYNLALNATPYTNSLEELEMLKQYLTGSLKQLFVERFETFWDDSTSFAHFNWIAP